MTTVANDTPTADGIDTKIDVTISSATSNAAESTTDKPVVEKVREIKPEAGTIEELRSLWQFAAISQYFQLFQEIFGLRDFDTQELETELISPQPDSWLIELQARMLRIATKNRFCLDDVWLLYLEREIIKRLEPGEKPLFTLKDTTNLPPYNSFDLKTRVLILHFICEMQLDRPDNFKPWTDTSEIDATGWRVEPIGTDSNGSKYWLFDDSRLYKETKQKKNPSWRLVCSTEEEWQCFPEQFKESKHKADKALYKYLTNDLIPLVIRDLEAARVVREQKKIRIQQEKEAYAEMLRQEEEYAKKLQEEENERIAREMERRELSRGVATRSKKNQAAPVVKTAAEIRAERVERREKRLLFEPIPRELRQPKKPKTKKYYDEEEEEISQTETEDDEEISLGSDSPPPRKRLTNRQQVKAALEESKANSQKSGSIGVNENGVHEETNVDNVEFVSSGIAEIAEKDWNFSCVCGVKGLNFDDGTPSISCDICNTWMHIKCVDDANDENFICEACEKSKELKNVLESVAESVIESVLDSSQI